METSPKIKEILKKLPDSPGIYKMISEEGAVIYIGKAKSLKKRVRQYFKKDYQHSSRTRKLVQHIENIEVIAVDSELEATILELNQIKQYKPKYNVIMKDDKNFVYIKITKEDFPRIQIVRQIKKDGAKYIGPKSAAHKVKTTFKVLKKIFPFRHCGLDIQMLEEKSGGDHKVKIGNKVIKYPCLDYFIKRCAAPCIGKVTPEEYRTIIKNVENFLDGKAGDVIKGLEEKMMTLAKEEKFEQAAKVRDKIQKITSILEKQKVATPQDKSKDIIAYCVTQNKAFFNLFQLRDGQLVEQENFVLSANEVEENSEDYEVLEAFLKQYYELATDIPHEIVIPHELANQKTLTEFISQHQGGKIKFIIPQKGKKNRLLEMSLNNARIYADRNKARWQEKSELTKSNATELQNLLKLKTPLKRIECYDISHLSGQHTVGSMIVFKKGAPDKSMYRKFQIRTLKNKPDDFKSMEEVLYRRFRRIANKFKNLDWKFKKVRKKDHKFIETHNEVNMAETDRNFFVVEGPDKKLGGFIAFKNYGEKLTEISNLWVHKDLHDNKLGYKLINEVIKKIKSKRIYFMSEASVKDYYLLAGFEEIKKLPEELEERFKQYQKKIGKPIICLSYDKNKHKEDKSFQEIPDLVVIDGGKGQLNVATRVFKELDLKIPHISLAKRLEEIFIPGEKQSILLPKNNEALKLLQRARDEAHRFAITYNKKLRSKRFKK